MRLSEFAPPGGDDREPNEEEILRKLAAQWWSGSEQQMARAQQALEAMGWEIGPDESGDEDAGVYVYRIGDDDGRDTIAFGHSELSLDEGEKSPMFKDTQRADRIRSLKNLIAIAREQGRQLRVQELELELKKLQGVTEAPGAETLSHNQSTVSSNLNSLDLGEGNQKSEPPEADYGDDYQAMVSRVKKLAGLGPLKTVYDPNKRVYKNVPVAVQPAQQPKKEQ